MRVSVIIPAYNAADTIADALESLLGQTSRHWDAIVVDDGSSDRTADVVERFVQRDGRIRLLRQSNRGEGAARNAGIARARCDWLLFLDADDWISPLHLERLGGVLASDPGLDAVHCGYARVAADGTQVADNFVPPSGDLFSTLARRAAFPVHSCIVRKSLVEEVGYFDTSLQRSADWDLWQRVARTGACFGAVPEVLAYYRIREHSISMDARQVLEAGLRVLRRGHSRDSRVPNPHPAHANGLPPERMRDQVYYLLCWCAGLALGAGEDTLPLLDSIGNDRCTELFPDAIAKCIFEAAPLPTSRARHCWEALWPELRSRVREFLTALEEHSGTPNLAPRTVEALKTRILKHTAEWRPVIEALEQPAARHQLRIAELERATQELERDLVQWKQRAEDQDAALARKQRQTEELERDRDHWRLRAADAERTVRTQRASLNELASKQSQLELESREHIEQCRVASAERDVALSSLEQRTGDFLLNRLFLRRPVVAAANLSAGVRQKTGLARLAVEGRLPRSNGRGRILATACSNFPIYSQTFVHQELDQLVRRGFSLRLVYSRQDPRANLSARFSQLWRTRRRLHLDRRTHVGDFARYRARFPQAVDDLVDRLCQASGMSGEALLDHDNFLQAFSFTRLVEAYRPDYLHSYFFYDCSLMALVAGYLLGIPRGVSCYADHVMQDYELKVVPLHMELCDIVIATSKRIKRELIEIAPRVDPERILVKPNGIDTSCFPAVVRDEPASDAPFRLVTVCRIEPKKGLLDMVDAVDMLRRRGVRVEAHIVGGVDEWSEPSRDYKCKLDRRITELDLWGTVHMEGRQDLDGIRRFLGIAQLFVAPFVETESGDKDGIPTALLEGMSTGLPAVATTAGSICEVIEDGRDGLLVSQRDPAALADAIEALLGDAERRRRLGAGAAEKVRSAFDVTGCERSFHDRLGEIVGRRSRHGVS